VLLLHFESIYAIYSIVTIINKFIPLPILAPDWVPPTQTSPDKKHGVFAIDNITYGDEDSPTEEENDALLLTKPCSVVLTQLGNIAQPSSRTKIFNLI
jgi:hypothetical protein